MRRVAAHIGRNHMIFQSSRGNTYDSGAIYSKPCAGLSCRVVAMRGSVIEPGRMRHGGIGPYRFGGLDRCWGRGGGWGHGWKPIGRSGDWRCCRGRHRGCHRGRRNPEFRQSDLAVAAFRWQDVLWTNTEVDFMQRVRGGRRTISGVKSGKRGLALGTVLLLSACAGDPADYGITGPYPEGTAPVTLTRALPRLEASDDTPGVRVDSTDRLSLITRPKGASVTTRRYYGYDH